MKGIMCPYCKGYTPTDISCKRGDKETGYADEDIENQMEHFCNDRYTRCLVYKWLERSWGHEKNQSVSKENQILLSLY